MSAFSQINNITKSEHATAALYILIIGLVLSDGIPTPADSFTLYLQRNLRDKWKNNEISAASYWRQNIFAYYAPNIFWWLLVLIIVVNIPGGIKNKAYGAIILVGAGAAVGIVYNLYKEDKVKELTNNI